jgi:hypothetical protein
MQSMNTKLLFAFLITEPDAESRVSDYFGSSVSPIVDYWKGVGRVFSQMLEQIDDRALARSLQTQVLSSDSGLYEAASDEPGLTVLESAQSAFIALLGEEVGEGIEVEITYA